MVCVIAVSDALKYAAGQAPAGLVAFLGRFIEIFLVKGGGGSNPAVAVEKIIPPDERDVAATAQNLRRIEGGPFDLVPAEVVSNKLPRFKIVDRAARRLK